MSRAVTIPNKRSWSVLKSHSRNYRGLAKGSKNTVFDLLLSIKKRRSLKKSICRCLLHLSIPQMFWNYKVRLILLSPENMGTFKFYSHEIQ